MVYSPYEHTAHFGMIRDPYTGGVAEVDVNTRALHVFGVISSGTITAEVDFTDVLAALAEIDLNTDGIEALLTAIDGHVDGLEATATAIAGSVDGLEALIAITNASLTVPVTLTDRSVAVTLGGTAQNAASANAVRKFLMIANPHTADDIYFSLTGTAAVNGTGSTRLVAGQGVVFDTRVPNGAVSVLSATTGRKVTVHEG